MKTSLGQLSKDVGPTIGSDIPGNSKTRKSYSFGKQKALAWRQPNEEIWKTLEKRAALLPTV